MHSAGDKHAHTHCTRAGWVVVGCGEHARKGVVRGHTLGLARVPVRCAVNRLLSI